MGRMSRRKGAEAERELAQLLTENGIPARRGRQFSGGPDSPDVVADLPDWHPEVKRVECFSLYPALDQAMTDSAGSKMPFVAHRRNKKPWVVICLAQDWLKLVHCQRAVEKLTGVRLKDCSSQRLLASLDALLKERTGQSPESAAGADA